MATQSLSVGLGLLPGPRSSKGSRNASRLKRFGLLSRNGHASILLTHKHKLAQSRFALST
jgi:hypothetical protein